MLHWLLRISQKVASNSVAVNKFDDQAKSDALWNASLGMMLTPWENNSGTSLSITLAGASGGGTSFTDGCGSSDKIKMKKAKMSKWYSKFCWPQILMLRGRNIHHVLVKGPAKETTARVWGKKTGGARSKIKGRACQQSLLCVAENAIVPPNQNDVIPWTMHSKQLRNTACQWWEYGCF